MLWAQLLIWIIIAVAALVIDAVTSSFFFIWFTIGGIVAIVLVLAQISFSIQIIVFIAVSLICMLIGYPIVKRTIKDTVPFTPTMEQSYIGHVFVAEVEIEKEQLIKYEGIYWTAKNVGEVIEKGDEAKIVGLEGTKLLVEKVK
ncbi:NfeD family protein [Clostridium sp. DL1XJH146]